MLLGSTSTHPPKSVIATLAPSHVKLACPFQRPAQHFSGEIHTDFWGPASIATHKRRRYFITFTDDATRFPTFYLMRTKDEALAAYKSFEAWALTQGRCTAIKAAENT